MRTTRYKGHVSTLPISNLCTGIGCNFRPRSALAIVRNGQSTHLQGMHRPPIWRSVGPARFQSAHPQGMQPSRTKRWGWNGTGFNPRTRRGCNRLTIAPCSNNCICAESADHLGGSAARKPTGSRRPLSAQMFNALRQPRTLPHLGVRLRFALNKDQWPNYLCRQNRMIASTPAGIFVRSTSIS